MAFLDAVLDHANANKAAIVGCSMGGMIAIDYTLAHPDRVGALVAVAAGMSGFPWQPTPGQARLETELETAIQAGDHDRIAQVARDLYAPLRTDPDVDERLGRLIANNIAGITTMGRLWRRGPNAYGRLGNIRVPTPRGRRRP